MRKENKYPCLPVFFGRDMKERDDKRDFVAGSRCQEDGTDLLLWASITS
jgi:hypothetical protein